MSTNTLSIEDDVKALLEATGKVVAYDTEVPDDKKLVKTPQGLIAPYIIYTFGGNFRPKTEAGIVGYAKDIHRATLVVQCVALTANDARQLNARIEEALNGWETTNSGLFELINIGANSNATGASKPTQYFRYSAYSFPYNL